MFVINWEIGRSCSSQRQNGGFSGSVRLRMQLAKLPGGSDDSMRDEQRAVIDLSLLAERKCRPRLQGGGVCPAGFFLPEVQAEHEQQEPTDGRILSGCF